MKISPSLSIFNLFVNNFYAIVLVGRVLYYELGYGVDSRYGGGNRAIVLNYSLTNEVADLMFLLTLMIVLSTLSTLATLYYWKFSCWLCWCVADENFAGVYDPESPNVQLKIVGDEVLPIKLVSWSGEFSMMS